jgi:hypothetical protein
MDSPSRPGASAALLEELYDSEALAVYGVPYVWIWEKFGRELKVQVEGVGGPSA